MGRKVNPIGFRLNINKTWEGRWFAEGREYVDQLHQDFALRDLVRKEACTCRCLAYRDRAFSWKSKDCRKHSQARCAYRPKRGERQESSPAP